MRIAVVANSAWYLSNFRLNLMRALRDRDCDVLAIGAADGHQRLFAEHGIDFAPFPASASGTNALREALAVWRLARTLRRARVDLVFSYTPKGNIYSALAARMAGARYVPNVSGLGRAFISPAWYTPVVGRLYKATFRRAVQVFFQNPDDRQQFIDQGLVSASQAHSLPGSGVDLVRFTAHPLPAGVETTPTFLMVARVLWDKGIGEYVEAARIVRRAHPGARFRLLGFVGADNPSAVPEGVLRSWVDEGVIDYLGSASDVRPHLAAAHCVVLPSYREGTPRTLLEAAATARPVITTDVPGCREALVPNVTGFLCRVRDGADLSRAMLRFIELDSGSREAMGHAGRHFMESRFSEQTVIDRYLEVVSRMLAAKEPASAQRAG